jgi:hypothetical protein
VIKPLRHLFARIFEAALMHQMLMQGRDGISVNFRP